MSGLAAAVLLSIPILKGQRKVTPISPKMNSPRYNEPDCMEALVAP